MKTRHIRTLVCAWALCSAVFLCASHADAATLVAQTTNTGSCVVSGGGCEGASTSIFPVANGFAASVQVFVVSATAGSELGIDVGGSGNYCNADYTFPSNVSSSYVSFPCTSNILDTASTSVSLTVSAQNLNGAPFVTLGTNGLAIGSGFNIYFEVFDENGNEGSQTRFIDPYVPANGAFSTTSPTTFAAAYYFNCDTDFGIYDSLTFQIIDTSNSSRNPVVSPQTLGICGGGNFQSSVTLTTGDTYLWRPEMFSSTGSSTPLFGNWYFFDSTSTPAEDINTAVGATIGTSTLPVTTNLLSFLNVPVLLETKFPFAYVFQIANGIQAGIAASSTSSIPSGDFVWTNFTGGTTTTDFFSQATIEYYLSPTLIAVWRAFLVVLLYVGIGYALYRRARRDLNLK